MALVEEKGIVNYIIYRCAYVCVRERESDRKINRERKGDREG